MKHILLITFFLFNYLNAQHDLIIKSKFKDNVRVDLTLDSLWMSSFKQKISAFSYYNKEKNLVLFYNEIKIKNDCEKTLECIKFIESNIFINVSQDLLKINKIDDNIYRTIYLENENSFVSYHVLFENIFFNFIFYLGFEKKDMLFNDELFLYLESFIKKISIINEQ